MSDPRYGEPVGEPVEDPRPVDDVVGSARAGLADAEASRDAVSAEDWDAAYSGSGTLAPRPEAASESADEPGASSGARPGAEPAVADRGGAAEAAREGADRPADAATTDAERTAAERTAAEGSTVRDEHADEAGAAATRAYTRADEPGVPLSASEPVAEPAVAAAPQPIFVQAPEAPTPRGNRGAAGAIGLLAALAFALIYLGAALGVRALGDGLGLEDLGAEALAAVTSFWLWVPVVVFFLSFWLLGAFINRGRWGLWVVFGLLVGLASYAGHLLGQLFDAPFWNIAPSQALSLVNAQAFAPLALVALVAGRELTIWFGAWVAARGRRVSELNAEAQREYERTLEAGPQLHRY